jgi:hypothetical protein
MLPLPSTGTGAIMADIGAIMVGTGVDIGATTVDTGAHTGVDLAADTGARTGAHVMVVFIHRGAASGGKLV